MYNREKIVFTQLVYKYRIMSHYYNCLTVLYEIANKQALTVF